MVRTISDKQFIGKDSYPGASNTFEERGSSDYDDIQRVVFDESNRMRGRAIQFMESPGPIIAASRVTDYWCYIEYKGVDGARHAYMLEIDKDRSPKLIEKMRVLFGDKVTIADFPEKAAKIEKKTLKGLQSKHDVTVDEKNHPMAEIKPDKALVVVVCPPTHLHLTYNFQFKIHANDHVVGVNREGTYTFFYLDLGEYMLASQSGTANGFRMDGLKSTPAASIRGIHENFTST